MIILNHREYRVAKARLTQLEAALSPESVIDNLTSLASVEVTDARQNAIREEARRLREEIENYESLRASGDAQAELSIDDLGLLPIVGRNARKLSQKQLADRLEVSEQQIQRYESDRYSSISLSRYQRVLEILGIDVRSKLQSPWPQFDIQSENSSAFEVDPSIIAEIRKKNWVSLPKGISKENAAHIIATYVSEGAELSRGRVLHRRSDKENVAPTDVGLVIWQARALREGHLQRAKVKVKFNLLDASWLNKLIALSTKVDGPLRAVEFLRERGIILAIVPHLPHTRLDGAAMLLADGTPLIGITLRYDRIDSFWFTLLHEIGHVFLHYNNGLEAGFLDDLDVETKNGVEREADLFALSALIPDGIWISAPARFAKNSDLVVKFAESLGIHPAIVAGRIRRERGNYKIFGELLGNGAIRSQFSDQLA
jgi:HTH-type transcriptional regulator/antitoxin HigA